MGNNWLDNAIDFVAPSWGFRRRAWRGALRAYDGASSGRRNAGWSAVNSTAEQADGAYRATLRARARDLERNSDILEAIVRPFERNVVGTGFRLQAMARNADGTVADEAINARIELLWRNWCRPWNCDVTRQQSFAELCRMAVRRMLVDGGVIFVKTYTGGAQLLPFQLQAREVDDLDTTFSGRTQGGNVIVAGVELDTMNRPVAYYLRTTTPDGFATMQPERVEASRVIMLYEKRRPSQVREISRLAPTIGRVRDINEYLEAVSVKERVAACLAVMITSQTPPSSLGRGTARTAETQDATSGYYGETLSPGMIMHLQPGEDAKAVMPPSSGGATREFVALQQRLAGAGQGLSYETTTRDMSETNYSSARQGRLEDQAEYDLLAQFLVDHLLDDVYGEFLRSAVLTGKIDLPGFWDNRGGYSNHNFMAVGMTWIDPLKEVKADQEAAMANLDTLANLCARRGLDWREVMEQRGREAALAEELKINATSQVTVSTVMQG